MKTNGEREEAWRRRIGDYHDPELFNKHATDKVWITINEEEPVVMEEDSDSSKSSKSDEGKPKQSFNNLSPIMKFKLIRREIKLEIHNFYYAKDGSVEILIFAEKADEIMTIKNFGDYKVDIKKHHYKNFVKGIIKDPVIRASSKEELIEGLSNCKVVDVYIKTTVERFENGKVKRDRSGEVIQIPTDEAEIKFELETPPPEVKLFGLNLPVKNYIPEAIQCRKCFKFSHTSKWCQSKKPKVCYWCSQNEHINKGERCPNNPQCINCPSGRNAHANISKDCPAREKEKEIQIIKYQNKCSYQQAKNRYEGAKSSYAKAVRNSAPTQTYANGTIPNPEEIMTRAAKSMEEQLRENMDSVVNDMKNRMEQQMQNMMGTMQTMMSTMMQNMFTQMTGQSLQTNLVSQMPTLPNLPKYYSPQAQGYIQNMHSYSNMSPFQGSGQLINNTPSLNTLSDVQQKDETFYSGQAGKYEEIPISLVQQLKPVGPGGNREVKLRLPSSEEPQTKAMRMSPGEPPPLTEPGEPGE